MHIVSSTDTEGRHVYTKTESQVEQAVWAVLREGEGILHGGDSNFAADGQTSYSLQGPRRFLNPTRVSPTSTKTVPSPWCSPSCTCLLCVAGDMQEEGACVVRLQQDWHADNEPLFEGLLRDCQDLSCSCHHDAKTSSDASEIF